MRSVLPPSFKQYYEPFLGGGAMFFDLCPAAAVLADRNEALIECYAEVRDHPTDVIACLSRMPNTSEHYCRIRSERPMTGPGRAARLIYLTTLSFNGIYRVNRRGEFNVPYGYKGHLQPCDEEKIRAASAALSRARLIAADFQESVKDAQASDLVYLDPPYTVAHSRNGFLKYNEVIFSWEDQYRLAEVARELVERGCYVVVSNAAYEPLEHLYAGFALRQISRASVMAASSNFRGMVVEYLFYAGPGVGDNPERSGIDGVPGINPTGRDRG